MSGLISGVDFQKPLLFLFDQLRIRVLKAFLGSCEGKIQGRARTVRGPSSRISCPHPFRRLVSECIMGEK